LCRFEKFDADGSGQVPLHMPQLQRPFFGFGTPACCHFQLINMHFYTLFQIGSCCLPIQFCLNNVSPFRLQLSEEEFNRMRDYIKEDRANAGYARYRFMNLPTKLNPPHPPPHPPPLQKQ
jgi:hypothetical protein